MNKLAKAPTDGEQDRALIRKHCWPLFVCLTRSPRTSAYAVAGTERRRRYRQRAVAGCDEKAMVEDSTLVVVQVNGKVVQKSPFRWTQRKNRFANVLAGTSGSKIS